MMFKRFLLLRWVLGSIVEGKSFLEEIMVTEVKLWTQTQMKQEVFTFLRWMHYVMNQS